MTTTFSVVICTEHEPDSLDAALQALALQEYPTEQIEVIVVDPDNNLKRRQAAEKHGAAYIASGARSEPAALNEGIRSSHGKMIAITDDDCEPVPLWLYALEDTLKEGTDLTGGPDRVPQDAPQFLKYLDYVLTSFAGSAGLRTKGRGKSAYYPRRWNMAFRREDMLRVGCLHESLRDVWEMEVANRFRERSYSVGFSPKAEVKHQRETDLWGYLTRNIRLARDRASLPYKKVVHALPAAGAAFFLGMLAASYRYPEAGTALITAGSLYLAVLGASGMHAAYTLRDLPAVVAIPLLIFSQHATHALGYFLGILRTGVSHVRSACKDIRHNTRV